VAALAIALAANVNLDGALDALSRVTLSKWRMEIVEQANGVVIINDAYNANPASMRAAIESLSSFSVTGRRLAIIGRMNELGNVHETAHRDIAAMVRDRGIELVAVDTDDYGVQGVSLAEARAIIDGLGAGDVALIKASRSIGLERLVEQTAHKP
jgi:UDP-N-acetylmuramoyl-tripeptide--D-alanyl-D-alanine ligase